MYQKFEFRFGSCRHIMWKYHKIILSLIKSIEFIYAKWWMKNWNWHRQRKKKEEIMTIAYLNIYAYIECNFILFTNDEIQQQQQQKENLVWFDGIKKKSMNEMCRIFPFKFEICVYFLFNNIPAAEAFWIVWNIYLEKKKREWDLTSENDVII